MSDTIVIAPDGTHKEYRYIEQSPTAGERPVREDEVRKQVRVYKYSVREEKGKPVFVKHLTNEEMKHERVR